MMMERTGDLPSARRERAFRRGNSGSHNLFADNLNVQFQDRESHNYRWLKGADEPNPQEESAVDEIDR